MIIILYSNSARVHTLHLVVDMLPEVVLLTRGLDFFGFSTSRLENE